MTTGAPVRRDALPEGVDYADTSTYGLGCEANPVVLGCLTCPLAVCKYDGDLGRIEAAQEVFTLRQQEISRRNRQRVLEVARDELSVREIAERSGVAIRTTYRILQRERVFRAEAFGQGGSHGNSDR